MQVKKWVLATAGMAILASCGDAGTSADNKTDTLSTTNTTVNTETTTKKVEVTGATRTAFEAKYPQASDITWQYHSPETVTVPIEWEWIDWKIDTSDYVANFKQDNTDYWAWYDAEGDWIATVSEISDNSLLPAAVNNTVKSQFPGYTIKSIDKENDKNRVAYEIQMEKGADKMKALIAENGQIMKKKGKVDGEKIKEKNNPKDSI